VRFKLKDEAGHDIVDAVVYLQVQKLDNDNNPIGDVMNATSAGGSNEGNLIRYSSSGYQYNLKTDNMDVGRWALYVYLVDFDQSPPQPILMEDAPIDGISTIIIIK